MGIFGSGWFAVSWALNDTSFCGMRGFNRISMVNTTCIFQVKDIQIIKQHTPSYFSFFFLHNKLLLKDLPYFFGNRTELFSFQNSRRDLDSSYKIDLDLWDCLESIKLVLWQNFIGLVWLFVAILEGESPSSGRIDAV